MGLKTYPRIMITGLGGDSGKTFVTCGLMRHYRDAGHNVGAFKKGPDYIDPEWLAMASGSTARNLDTYMMSKDVILKNFRKNATPEGINIFEGNRGLYDGFDSSGTHSSAELAKLLQVPVILVVSVKKVTRTVAAIVLGCKLMDKDLNIAGVVLNQVANTRQGNLVKEAIENETGIPVLGVIPKLSTENMPARHLGLITPGEYKFAEKAIETAAKIIAECLDTDEILKISNQTTGFEEFEAPEPIPITKDLKIGYFYDKAFSFYYEDNLEQLSDYAELVKISSIDDKAIPDIDALYIGGGFPETNADALSSNKELMSSLKEKVELGLPVYAECGGLMYLAETIEFDDKKFEMSGVLPIQLKMSTKPVGHGYIEAIVDTENQYFPLGDKIRGHEFHYSYISECKCDVMTCLNLSKGVGLKAGRDGIFYKNVFASYIHIHAASSREWVKGIVKMAKLFKNKRI